MHPERATFLLLICILPAVTSDREYVREIQRPKEAEQSLILGSPPNKRVEVDAPWVDASRFPAAVKPSADTIRWLSDVIIPNQKMTDGRQKTWVMTQQTRKMPCVETGTNEGPTFGAAPAHGAFFGSGDSIALDKQVRISVPVAQLPSIPAVRAGGGVQVSGTVRLERP
jgi:hypothetical protein